MELYQETLIFILVDITVDVVESIACKLSGSTAPGGTDLEALQDWILKVGDDRKKLCISVEYLVDCLANIIPPWAAY